MYQKLTNLIMFYRPCMHAFLILLLSFKADGASLIRRLPGFSGELPINLETGYVGVGQHEKVQLFYYFVESQRDPMKDPLILWLVGGPGCSGLYGLFFEHGPFMFDYKAFNGSLPTFISNPDSLTQVANMIYLDAPVGTGFSYSETDQDYHVKDDFETADANYQFLQKWLLDHPKFANNPLYIGGSSYSGKIVPLIVHNIHEDQKKKQALKMNLQGYILGNPLTDKLMEISMLVPFANRLGFISDELYESFKETCSEEYLQPNIKSALCLQNQQDITKCIEVLCKDHVLEPMCGSTDFVLNRTLKGRYVSIEEVIDVFQGRKPWCRNYNYVPSNIWANDPAVMEALHVRTDMKNIWHRCNVTLKEGYPLMILKNVVDYHRSFFKTGYRAIIYSGDYDTRVPRISTTKWIASLNLTVSDRWRPWMVLDQAVGYTTTFKYQDTYELTYATIKGAGHIVPEYKPKPCFEMLNRWLAHSKL